MDEKKYKELLEEIKGLRHEISWLTRRLEFYEHLFRRYGFPPFPSLDEEEFEIWLRRWRKHIQEEGISIDKWIETHKEEIKSISMTLRKHDISPQDATLLYSIKLADMTSYLASKSLLTYCGHCEGGQLQLLVEDNAVYLTCPKCGRWLWQGLKHEE